MTKEKSHHEPGLENFTGQIYANGTMVDSDIADSLDIESQKNSYKEKLLLAEKIALQECGIKNGSKMVASPNMREAIQRKLSIPILQDFIITFFIPDSASIGEVEQGKFEVYLGVSEKKHNIRYQFSDFKNALEKKDFVLIT